MYLARSEQPVGGGSDSPVTPFEPLLGIWSSVTRQTYGAGVQGPEWKISAEAIRDIRVLLTVVDGRPVFEA